MGSRAASTISVSIDMSAAPSERISRAHAKTLESIQSVLKINPDTSRIIVVGVDGSTHEELFLTVYSDETLRATNWATLNPDHVWDSAYYRTLSTKLQG